MKVKVRVRNMSSTALLNLPPLRRGGLADPLRAIREHPLLAFFILAFAFTWVIEIPMQVWRIAPMQLLVGYMPGLAALLVAGAIGGRSGVRTFLRTLLIWRVGVQWYGVALFGFLVVWFGTQALNPLFGGTGIHLPTLSLALVAAFIAELVLRMLLSSEQLAWSGFALPRLQARHLYGVGFTDPARRRGATLSRTGAVQRKEPKTMFAGKPPSTRIGGQQG